MNKREVMKVENLVRNYKMVYSDRQGEEEKNRNLSGSWENQAAVRQHF